MAQHRKVHSNAWETNLTPEQRTQAFELARSLGYIKAASLIAKEFGIRAPSLAGMARFYEREGRIRQDREIEKALVDVGNLDHLADNLPGINKATKAALGKAYLDALITQDPERIKLFAELSLKHQAQDDQAARTSMLLEKHKNAVAAAQAAVNSAKRTGGLSAETADAITKALTLTVEK